MINITGMTVDMLKIRIEKMYEELCGRAKNGEYMANTANTAKIAILENMERECHVERKTAVSRGQFHWHLWSDGTQAVIEDNWAAGGNSENSPGDGRYVLTINTVQDDGRLESLEWIDSNSLTDLQHIGEIYLHGSFSQTLSQIKTIEGYNEQ